MMNLKCPSCGQAQRVSDEVLGGRVSCTSCGAVFRVAAPSPRPAAPAARPPGSSASTTRARAVAVGPKGASTSGWDFPPPPKFDGPGGGDAGVGVAPWVYGVIAGLAGGIVLALVLAIAVRSSGGSGSGPGTFPDPGLDIAQGIAGMAGKPEALATATSPAVASPAGSTGSAYPPAAPGGAPLTTAQIVARWEPSVALVKGHASSGTGFIVRPGIVATNAHVINEEFVGSLEVRFPSAPAGKQGPYRAELLDEDARRDLAFLRVDTDLPAMEVAPSYRFMKGEDITVIGSPGLGDEVVLENAISRGVMSSKVVLDGLNYLQLSIAINPGNSGGPVFDSWGRVIGVATLKSTKAEALAFCIPVEDLNAAIARLGRPRADVTARHRLRATFTWLAAAGAAYGAGIEVRAVLLRGSPQGAPTESLLTDERVRNIDTALKDLDRKQLATLDAEVGRIRADDSVPQPIRDRYQQLNDGYRAMKQLYANTNQPAAQYAMQVRQLRDSYLANVQALERDLNAKVPDELMALLKKKPNDAQQETTVMQIVPGQLPPRILGPRIRPPGMVGPQFPRPPMMGPPGIGMGPGMSAHQRMQEFRNRMMQRHGNRPPM